VSGLTERLRAICLALPEVTERPSQDAYRVIAPARLAARLDD
jgi:hypothetical protein